MSARLSIVLSQAGSQIANGRDLEGELVAHLIGSAGMDLSLIGPLEQLGQAATDQLVIDGLSGDFALLAWDEPAVSLAHLAAASVPGYRAPHQLDPEPAAQQSATPAGQTINTGGANQPAPRRIYCVNLRNHSIASVRAGLEKILLARRTPTISLGSLAAGSSDSSRRPDEQATDSPARAESPATVRTEAARNHPSGKQSPATSEPPKEHPAPPRRHPAAGTADVEAESSDPLDALVDDLNAFDI